MEEYADDKIHALIDCLSTYIDKFSDSNLNTRLLKFKLYKIFTNIHIISNPDNKVRINNLLLLLLLPHSITSVLYTKIDYIRVKELLELDESNLFVKRDKINQPILREESMFHVCKCGSKNIHIYEKQTRSIDEPTTVFVKCLKCNNKWVSKY